MESVVEANHDFDEYIARRTNLLNECEKGITSTSMSQVILKRFNGFRTNKSYKKAFELTRVKHKTKLSEAMLDYAGRQVKELGLDLREESAFKMGASSAGQHMDRLDISTANH